MYPLTPCSEKASTDLPYVSSGFVGTWKFFKKLKLIWNSKTKFRKTIEQFKKSEPTIKQETFAESKFKVQNLAKRTSV